MIPSVLLQSYWYRPAKEQTKRCYRNPKPKPNFISQKFLPLNRRPNFYFLVSVSAEPNYRNQPNFGRILRFYRIWAEILHSTEFWPKFQILTNFSKNFGFIRGFIMSHSHAFNTIHLILIHSYERFLKCTQCKKIQVPQFRNFLGRITIRNLSLLIKVYQIIVRCFVTLLHVTYRFIHLQLHSTSGNYHSFFLFKSK